MNTQERALEKAKEKVEALLWESPEGLTISNITGDLRISVPLAKSALKAIGAVYEGGVWVLHDDDAEPVAVAVAAPAIGITDTSPTPASQPVEKQELGIPVSEEKQTDTSKGIPVDHQPNIDWANAPEGATHWIGGLSQHWHKKENGGWSYFTKSFNGWVLYAFQPANFEGEVIPHPDFDMAEWGIANFQKECERVANLNAKSDSAPACTACHTKSDFALAVEAEREKVLTVIQSGATLARVVELTGLHIDDAQHHVDVLVDLGRVVARPVVVAVAYEVVA